MKQKKSVEDYLKTIYILSRKKDVHGADIAKEIGVSRPTVCVSLKALAEEGYLLMDDAHEIHLTEKGMQIAKETYERHDTFCRLKNLYGREYEEYCRRVNRCIPCLPDSGKGTCI